MSGVFKDKAAILVRCWRPKDDETLCWKQQQRVCIMKPEASSFHNPRSYWKLTWGQKADRLTPTLEESPRARQSENEASVSSYLSTFCWVSPLGSRILFYSIFPASPAPRDDTGLLRGDCSAVIIRRAGQGTFCLSDGPHFVAFACAPDRTRTCTSRETRS